jgi:hypothetical protein
MKPEDRYWRTLMAIEILKTVIWIVLQITAVLNLHP